MNLNEYYQGIHIIFLCSYIKRCFLLFYLKWNDSEAVFDYCFFTNFKQKTVWLLNFLYIPRSISHGPYSQLYSMTIIYTTAMWTC